MVFITVNKETGKIAFPDPNNPNYERVIVPIRQNGKILEDRLESLLNFLTTDQTSLELALKDNSTLTLTKEGNIIEYNSISENKKHQWYYENTPENVNSVIEEIKVYKTNNDEIKVVEVTNPPRHKLILAKPSEPKFSLKTESYRSNQSNLPRLNKSTIFSSQLMYRDGELNKKHVINLLADKEIISRKYGILFLENKLKKVPLMDSIHIFIFYDDDFIEDATNPDIYEELSEEDLKFCISRYIVCSVESSKLWLAKHVNDINSLSKASYDFSNDIINTFDKSTIKPMIFTAQNVVYSISIMNEIYSMKIPIPNLSKNSIYPTLTPIFANLDDQVEDLPNIDDTKYSNYKIPIVKLSEIKENRKNEDFFEKEQVRFLSFLNI